jgi:hypothetical protein
MGAETVARDQERRRVMTWGTLVKSLSSVRISSPCCRAEAAIQRSFGVIGVPARRRVSGDECVAFGGDLVDLNDVDVRRVHEAVEVGLVLLTLAAAQECPYAPRAGCCGE